MNFKDFDNYIAQFQKSSIPFSLKSMTKFLEVYLSLNANSVTLILSLVTIYKGDILKIREQTAGQII